MRHFMYLRCHTELGHLQVVVFHLQMDLLIILICLMREMVELADVKVVVEECETAYNAQKGVECYEATKGKGALVYNPLSTGITLQLIPKAPVDQIPVLSMGYGLSAVAMGDISVDL